MPMQCGRSLLVGLLFVTVAVTTPTSSPAATLGVDGGAKTLKRLGTKDFRILGSFEAWSNRRDAAKAIREARSVGAIPLITWEPWKPPAVGTQNQGSAQPRYSNRSIAAGRHDRYIRSFAKSLARYRRTVYLRFAHEFPGGWYPWSIDPVNYKRAWRRIHLIFKRSGAGNVRFVWSPQLYVNRMGERGRPYWPGTRYVDFVSTSFVYFGRSSQGPHAPMIAGLSQLSEFGKPAIISEANVEYSVRHEVMRDLATFVKANDWIRAVVWSQSISRGQREWAKTKMEWPLHEDPQAIELLRSMR